MAFVYRTTGAWGAGKGSNLTAAEGDGNFYEVETRLDDLEDSRPQPDNFASVSVEGTQISFTLVSGTELGPVDLPVLVWRYRDDWLPFTIYAALDTFRVSGQGLYLVRLDHTSAATFDPDAVGPAQVAGTFSTGTEYTITTVGTTDFTAIGAASNTIGVIFTATGAGTGTGTATPTSPLYSQLIGIGSETTLGDLNDVDLNALADNNFLVYTSGTSEWTNRTTTAVTALLDEFVGDFGSPGGELKGLVPAPSTGDADEGRKLDASGMWLGTSDRAPAVLPLDYDSLVEVAEPAGSPVGSPPSAYASRSVMVADLLSAPRLGVLFASLPSAASVPGATARITNSNTATWGATIAGGGANNVLGWSNGTNWTVIGA